MRRGRKTVLALSALALAAGALAAPAQAANSQSLDAAVRLVNQPRGKPWTIGLQLTTQITDTAGGHPAPLRHMEMSFPRATVNARAFPSCSLAKLRRNPVPQSCPRKSLLGKGSALADATILTEPVTLYMFNGQRKGGKIHFYFLAAPLHISQKFVFDATLARQRGTFGWKLSMDIPPIHVLTNVPDVAIAKFSVTVGASTRVRGRTVPLLQAPTSCPAGGWRFHGLFVYGDGSRGTTDAKIDCVLHSS